MNQGAIAKPGSGSAAASPAGGAGAPPGAARAAGPASSAIATDAREGPSTLPLTGVRVLEVATLLPGPYCGLILSDLGADVVKVEPPGGDPLRWVPPHRDGESVFFAALNRGKRSVVLDLRDPGDRERFLDLSAEADVLLEGWRPGVAARLGVDAPRLHARNPRLVCCAITGFGQEGPLASRAGHDAGFLARSGILAASGCPACGPVLPGVQVADLAGGALPATVSILAALLERERTGRGRTLDVAMADGALALLLMHHAAQAAQAARTAGVPPGEGGDPAAAAGSGLDILLGRCPCYRVYPTADGHLVVAAIEPKFWKTFCEVIGRADLLGDAYACGERGQKVIAEVAAVLGGRTTSEWTAAFAGRDACVEAVRPVGEVFGDPELRRRGLLFDAPHTEGGTIEHLRPLPAYPGPLPATALRPAPRLGEHQTEVLDRWREASPAGSSGPRRT